jgi:hypothetical protein
MQPPNLAHMERCVLITQEKNNNQPSRIGYLRNSATGNIHEVYDTKFRESVQEFRGTKFRRPPNTGLCCVCVCVFFYRKENVKNFSCPIEQVEGSYF